jgi:hypothetical protein
MIIEFSIIRLENHESRNLLQGAERSERISKLITEMRLIDWNAVPLKELQIADTHLQEMLSACDSINEYWQRVTKSSNDTKAREGFWNGIHRLEKTLDGAEEVLARLRRSNKRWWHGGDWVGWSLGILGIIMGFYLYYRAERNPELVFWIDPIPTRIIDITDEGIQAVKIVKPDGTQIGKDLYSVRAIIWNRGNAGIRESDILEPLKVTIIGTNIDVLRVRVEKASRAAVGITSVVSSNSLTVKFRAMDPTDGALIQFIYLGDEFATLDIKGSIFGMKTIEPATVAQERLLGRAGVVLLVLMSILLVWMIVRFVRAMRAERAEGRSGMSKWIVILIMLGAGAYCGYRNLPELEAGQRSRSLQSPTNGPTWLPQVNLWYYKPGISTNDSPI